MSSHHLATSFHAASAAARRHNRKPRTRIFFTLLATLIASGAQAGSSGSLALTSDYVFRGVSQSNQQPALQGGIEYAADNGAYIGSWGSSISWLSDLSTTAAPVSSSLELDVYGGWRGKLGDAVSLDLGALHYAYPGEFPAGFNRADTLELYAGLTFATSDNLSLGAKYSASTTDLFGYVDSKGSGYLDLSASYALNANWSLSAHVGQQWIKHNADFDYRDWKLGVSRSFASGTSLALSFTGTDADDALYTNAHGNRLARDAVALTQAF